MISAANIRFACSPARRARRSTRKSGAVIIIILVEFLNEGEPEFVYAESGPVLPIIRLNSQ